MRSYKIDDSARLELFEALDYYLENGGPEIAIEFLESFESTRDRLRQFPFFGRKVRDEIRALSLKKYPYTIFYLYEQDCVYIVTIAHHGRGPDYLQGRLQDFA